MKNNLFLKLLGSIPVILISLYFVPFLGICLILFRYFMYHEKRKRIATSVFLIGIGIVILVPKILEVILQWIKFDITKIPYINEVIQLEVYQTNFMSYSKLLLIVGILFLILTFILQRLFEKLEEFLKLYIQEHEKRNREISSKNDLLMKEKQEKAKNTSVVYCPYCGADNILTSNIGVCKYCRRQIVAKK